MLALVIFSSSLAVLISALIILFLSFANCMLSNQMVGTVRRGVVFSTAPLGIKHYAVHEYCHSVLSDYPLKVMKVSLS